VTLYSYGRQATTIGEFSRQNTAFPKNFQRYLKHEVAAASDESEAIGRFTSLSWHPEKPLYLLLTTPRQFE
jgi:hypothetical protein